MNELFSAAQLVSSVLEVSLSLFFCARLINVFDDDKNVNIYCKYNMH